MEAATGAPLDGGAPHPALAALARALFPATAAACPDVRLPRLAATGSVGAGAAALGALAGALRARLAPETCFSLLAAARASGVPAFLDDARSACVRWFGDAVAADAAGWAALDASAVASVLADPALAATEDAAWAALAAWVDADIETRSSSLPALVERCVGVARLSLPAIRAVDAHPALRDCENIIRAVAGAVLGLHTGQGGGWGATRAEAAAAAAAAVTLCPTPPACMGAATTPARKRRTAGPGAPGRPLSRALFSGCD